MSSIKGKFYGLIALLILLGIVGGFVVFKWYPYVFTKTVTGEIVGVERVNTNETIIMGGANVPASQIFSFAVAIKDGTGETHTASSEDRQWAVVEKGKCAEAKFLPYPPWELQKWGTYFGARLIRLFDCPDSKDAKPAEKTPPAAAPAVPPAPPVHKEEPKPAKPSAADPAEQGPPASPAGSV